MKEKPNIGGWHIFESVSQVDHKRFLWACPINLQGSSVNGYVNLCIYSDSSVDLKSLLLGL